MVKKNFCLISLIVFYNASGNFKLGIENTDDAIWQHLQTKNNQPAVGLITNQTGVDQKGTHTIDLLLQRNINIKRIFAPEHGLTGMVEAEKEVEDSVHTNTNIPIVSLYGHGTGKKIVAHKINDLDLLIFDMQDSGMRHYTYISTLLHAMETAAHHDKPFVVLDRPNPLGARQEGAVTEKHTKSFIAAASIPLRHGMTIGELARYFNAHVLEKKVKLHVVKLLNYERTLGLPGNLLAPLSPNIPNKEACYGYSFLGLLGEVRPFDIGLGTDKPMQCLGLSEKISFAPVQWKKLQALLEKNNIHSQLYNYHSARKKQNYRGLLFDIQDINKAASFDTVLTILKFFKDAKVELTFSKYFDTAIGTSKVQEYVGGTITHATLMAEINTNLKNFNDQAKDSYLYYPMPTFV